MIERNLQEASMVPTKETFGETTSMNTKRSPMIIPNLDAMTENDLMKFWMRYQNVGKRADCAALLGSRFPGYTIIAGNLGAYAANKATAMRCRAGGDVPAALVYEGICDRIYNELPERFRW